MSHIRSFDYHQYGGYELHFVVVKSIISKAMNIISLVAIKHYGCYNGSKLHCYFEKKFKLLV